MHEHTVYVLHNSRVPSARLVQCTTGTAIHNNPKQGLWGPLGGDVQRVGSSEQPAPACQVLYLFQIISSSSQFSEHHTNHWEPLLKCRFLHFALWDSI